MGHRDAVQEHGQIRLLGGVVYRVVTSMTPEWLYAGARQVDPDDAWIVRILSNFACGISGTLRNGDDASEKALSRVAPVVDKPGVVGPRQRGCILRLS